MLIFEEGYKKICIWKDELPIEFKGNNTISLCEKRNNINWHEGIICLEARIRTGHISNYAMICIKYNKKQSDKTDIFININEDENTFCSHVLPNNKAILIGLDEEFAEAIKEFLNEYTGDLPYGNIEIFGGYDDVGSSNFSFKKVMELIIFVCSNIDKLSSDAMSTELFKIIS